MRNAAARIAILAGAAFAQIAAFASAGGAQQIRPTPTPAACARPNAVASVIRAAPTDVPAMAQQQGLQGIVRMIVSLDADSRVAGVRVQSSPSAILNQAALAAARQSTYQTEIRDCRPVAVDYLYPVYVGEGDGTFTLVAGGTAMRAPDVAYVQASILTYDDATESAVAKGDAALDALKAKLGALGISAGKIRWWPLPPGIRDERAAARHVEITVDTVAIAGHVAAAAASVKSVEAVGIRYAVTDSAAAFRDALKNALKDAEKTAREALALQKMQLGALKYVAVSPNGPMQPSTDIVPFRLVPVAGGFKEPDIRIPDVEVHASATVTYEIKP
ncbi:MAG TPA: SIMPL domain-containing protein [Candidatus Elarobacter sp.]|nr:SIMPL domain-containing protein [Candidatus Elarobacter sp.]